MADEILLVIFAILHSSPVNVSSPDPSSHACKGCGLETETTYMYPVSWCL